MLRCVDPVNGPVGLLEAGSSLYFGLGTLEDMPFAY